MESLFWFYLGGAFSAMLMSYIGADDEQKKSSDLLITGVAWPIILGMAAYTEFVSRGGR
jgi:hypothetical protein